jgi:excisionase family DNA binding protein
MSNPNDPPRVAVCFSDPPTDPEPKPVSPWLTVEEAAWRARCGLKTIYREVSAGRLRAARIGGRRELRFLAEWIDEWLVASSTPVEITR